jgi:ketosteroid isomerase-like protein
MKRQFIFIFLVVPMTAFAQDAAQEINAQVWKPFINAFNVRDTKAFMDVHSKDVVRSSRDSKTVLNWSEYFSQMEKGDKREKESKNKRELELRFTERIASKDLAIDVGIYKTTYTTENKPPRSFYGRFHVVLRKESGTWKILVDTDSSEGNTITEQDFLAARPME